MKKSAILFALVASFMMPLTAIHAVEVQNLRCEYLKDPLGIDAIKPRLSWVLEDDERGQKQTAYQILVASTPETLAKDQGDHWDSGKVAGDRSNHVDYAGKPLASQAACHWKVRVWDKNGRKSDWSKPALWTMGLLKPEDWTAKWIGYDAAEKLSPEEAADAQLLNLRGLGWHQVKDGKPGAVSCFRKSFEIAADRKVRRAVLVLYAYHFCEAAVNGTAIGSSAHWLRTARLDATKALHAGKNLVTLAVSHTDPYPPAVIGKLVVQFESGPDEIVPIDKTWKAAQSPADGWQTAGFDDSAWNEAASGGYTFGVQADLDRVPAPYLRKNFEVGGKVKRAMVYVTALGTYELRLNGKKVGNDVLTPGWPEFRKRVHYQTYDVTGQLQPGAKAGMPVTSPTCAGGNSMAATRVSLRNSWSRWRTGRRRWWRRMPTGRRPTAPSGTRISSSAVNTTRASRCPAGTRPDSTRAAGTQWTPVWRAADKRMSSLWWLPL